MQFSQIMSKTHQNIFPLKTKVPKFRLKDTNSNFHYSFDDLKGKMGTLVIFISNQCPHVTHVLPEILMIAGDYKVQGIGIIAISSNDVEKYPLDSPKMMTEFAFKNSFDFPYLFDENQEVATEFGANCTPDFYLFDAEDKLFYRGQLDDSRPGNGIPLSGSDLRNAIDALVYNRSFPELQKPSVGCDIIWK